MRTPLVRLLFCLMAVLMILWDFMLLITVLYFHMMIEKGKNEETIFKRTPSKPCVVIKNLKGTKE